MSDLSGSASVHGLIPIVLVVQSMSLLPPCGYDKTEEAFDWKRAGCCMALTARVVPWLLLSMLAAGLATLFATLGQELHCSRSEPEELLDPSPARSRGCSVQRPAETRATVSVLHERPQDRQ